MVFEEGGKRKHSMTETMIQKCPVVYVREFAIQDQMEGKDNIFPRNTLFSIDFLVNELEQLRMSSLV